MSGRIVYLMYHELELPQRQLCEQGQGYARYVVRVEDFRAQVERLQKEGIASVSVGDALRQPSAARARVAVTFDDGCETDLTVAAPILREAGFNATFFITVGHLGERGYLRESQLRQLSDLGFEIGSHAMTHTYLHDLTTEQIQAQVVESKARLEQITGKPVRHFSCPGGRWDKRVSGVVRASGYDSLVTSSVGINTPKSDNYHLARVPILRGIGIEDFARISRGEGLGMRRAQSAVLNAAKLVLGNSMYERIRASVLE